MLLDFVLRHCACISFVPNRYILWAEQMFPKGGPDSVLTKLLERCASQFNTDERYKNDERYIFVWMKMVCNAV